jgi:hypothetical protein
MSVLDRLVIGFGGVVPGWTRASLAAGSIESTLLTCFDQSRTTATLQQPPVRLVPPPRERIGAPWRRQTSTVRITSSTSLGITPPIGTWR